MRLTSSPPANPARVAPMRKARILIGPVRMPNVLFRMSETPGAIKHAGRAHGVFDWEAGDALIVENGCVHQHFNDDPDESAILLVFKAKPLFLFMHMMFQKVVTYPPKEPSPTQANYTPPPGL